MKNLMKKIMLIGLSVILILCASACGKDTKETPVDESNSSSAQINTEDVDSSASSDAETDILKEDAAENKTDNTEEKSADNSKQAEAAPDTQNKNTASESQTPEATAPVSASTADQAMAYIGQSAGALASSIGQPSSKSYATSCIGEGDDGEWYYDGFTVYTYRDTNGNETIEDVFAN